ncbi:MAG: hypothetical protein ACREEH_00720, partial [Caulobacteraceae bacterium]
MVGNPVLGRKVQRKTPMWWIAAPIIVIGLVAAAVAAIVTHNGSRGARWMNNPQAAQVARAPSTTGAAAQPSPAAMAQGATPLTAHPYAPAAHPLVGPAIPAAPPPAVRRYARA